eukprot:4765564-Prymnesium_polylepis.1
MPATFGNVFLPSPSPSTKRPSIEGVSAAIFVRASSVGMLGRYCRLHEPIASGVPDLNSLCVPLDCDLMVYDTCSALPSFLMPVQTSPLARDDVLGPLGAQRIRVPAGVAIAAAGVYQPLLVHDAARRHDNTIQQRGLRLVVVADEQQKLLDFGCVAAEERFAHETQEVSARLRVDDPALQLPRLERVVLRLHLRRELRLQPAAVDASGAVHVVEVGVAADEREGAGGAVVLHHLEASHVQDAGTRVEL